MMIWKRARAGWILPVLAGLPLAAGCSDPFGPLDWNATPDTATIWSASRADLVGYPSAFDFALSGGPVYIETPSATAAWDVVLIDLNGGLALAPASYFEGQAPRAAIAIEPNTALSAVTKAPADSSSYVQVPVPLQAGTVYVIRTRTALCESGYTTGTRYSKIRPVTIDDGAGTLTFEVVRNPYCSNRDFIPPSGG